MEAMYLSSETMFTGIIEEIGRVATLVPYGRMKTLSVVAERTSRQLKEGDSISVNGVCLTVEKISGQAFSATLSEETIARTNLGAVRTGDGLNLERALVYGERIAGHLLTGHVDGTAVLIEKKISRNSGIIKVRFPRECARYVFPKCSIGLDGISLTAAEVFDDILTVWIIPYTLQNTTIGSKPVGSKINFEADMLVKASVNENMKEKKYGRPNRKTCI